MFAWFSLGFNAFQLAAAGGVMVSLPIVIHLINRMRFRRIRWAAMEFLLKAQKRQRRRLIIEQLILLAMRCLLIAMIGYWLGSFVGFGGDVLNPVGEKQVLHVVILDDSPSMGDAWKDRGIDKTNAFDEAKKVLRERIGPRIVESATRNGSAEYVVVYRLSEIQPVVEDQVLDEDDEAVFADRLNQSSLEELTKLLGDPPMAKPSAVRVRGNPELMAWTLLGRKYANRQLVPEDEWKQVVSDMDAHVLPQRVALDKAQRVFEGKAPEVFEREGHKALFKKDLHAATKQFYFLSDFREVDWKGPNSDKLREKMDEMVNKKSIKVYGVDCSDPNRGDTRGTLQHHENIGITSFQAEVAVAPEFEPVKFSLVVNNFTNRRFENVHLIVKENGIERPEAHPEGTPFLTLPSGPTVVSWKMSLDKPGINHIEATIEDPEGLRDTGLAADNTRYTVVKVEKLVHILAVEEEFKNPPRGKDGRGDSSKAPDTTGTFYLQKVLRKGYQLDSGRIDDLEKPTLFQYPCVFIMNVPDLSKAAIENLEKFAAEGGGVCFFLGDKVKPEEYNRTLFKDGTGLFPAPLDPRIKNLEPTTDEEKARDIQERAARFLAQEPNLFVRDENHPMFAPVYKEEDPDKFVNKFLMFFELKQYFSVDSLRYKKVGDADKVEELFTLPNRKGVQQYMPRANQLAGQLPTSDDPAWKEFQPTLETHRKRLLENTFGRNYKELFELANDVYRLLHEPGNPDGLIKDQPKRPGLDKFWQDPRNDSLRKQFEQFMEDVRYGDPFLVARQFGKGRVIACMSTASGAWNNWALSPPLYVPFMPALTKYLFSLADSPNFDCGSSLPAKMSELDAKTYAGKMEVWQVPQQQKRPDNVEESAPDYETKMGWSLIQSFDKPAEDGVYKYDFHKAKEPGVYVVKRFPLPVEEGVAIAPERRGVTFNIDAASEGDLRRTSSESLEKKKAESEEASGLYLVDRTAKFEELSKKQANYSESPWFYLALLMLLVAEQAMAVHCGHHTRATDLPASAEISMHTGRAQATAA